VEPARWDELVEVMGALADGDDAAVFTLHERFGDKVAGTVRAVLRSRGVHPAGDDVDGLVLEACLAIAAVARAWSPTGGAAPWAYARRRIENVVDRAIGQHTVPLDEHLPAIDEGRLPARPPLSSAPGVPATPEAAPAGRDESLLDALARLVAVDERCRLLSDALEQAAVTPTDRELTLQYAAEQRSGNRSPATTVAAMFDLRDAAVRQRVHRSRGRLRAVTAREQRFAPLADLPLLA
jgi:DNA-directed RNA polymerase specialized sigma24 family protein